MATALLFASLPSSSLSFFVQTDPNFSSPTRCFPPSLSVARTLRASFRCGPVCASPSATSELLDISKLGISEDIVSALSRRGITELFPIQRAVLEPAMEGRDMIGRAITGSGKTLAFGIPILDKIMQQQSHHRKKRVPSALVLAPTRELARQVQREFEECAPNLSSTCLYGGVPITNQVRSLGFGIDIAVGTPGRIIDLVERGALNLTEIKFVVLDEADQMLDVGFQVDVECILDYLPAKKQCLLFSATMPSWVNELSKKYLKNPLVVDLVGESDQKLAEGISLFSVLSSASGKQNLLPDLISQYGNGGKTIIFTKTRNDAEELSRSMGRIIGSKALHGNMHQTQRDKTIAAFSKGRFNVLVATDVAARGLDIPDVDLVIHFEMPNTSEIFVHRSGRTGRAGKKGTAVLMFTERQRRDLRSIESDLSCKFEELPRNVDVGGQNKFIGGRGSAYKGRDELIGNWDQSHVDQNRSTGRSGSYRGRDESLECWDQSCGKQNSFTGGRGYSFMGRDESIGRREQSHGNGKFQKVNFSESRFSNEGRFGDLKRFKKSDILSVHGAGQGHYRHRSHSIESDDDLRDNEHYSFSRKTPRAPVANYFRNHPRSTTIRSKNVDAIYGGDSKLSKEKARPSNFDPDSFEQILDIFKDHC